MCIRDRILSLVKDIEQLDTEHLSRSQLGIIKLDVAMKRLFVPVSYTHLDVYKRQADGTALETVWKSRWMPDPLKKNREKFYYNKTGIDIQNLSLIHI